MPRPISLVSLRSSCPASGGHFRLCYAREEAEWDSTLDRIVAVLECLARQAGISGSAEWSRHRSPLAAATCHNN